MNSESGTEIKANPGATGFIRGVHIVCARELGAMFDSSIAYIYFIAFSLLSVGIFMNDFFIRAVIDMSPYFDLLPLLLAVFIPALTMKIWAEEKRILTFELLITLPLKTSQLSLGKFAALYFFYLLTLCSSLPVVAMLYVLGSPDTGLLISGYVAAALIGAMFISIGIFTSGLTDNQIVAFVISAFFCFIFVVTGSHSTAGIIDGLVPALQAGSFLYDYFSAIPHYCALAGGVLAVSDIFYFAAMAVLFLWFNVLNISGSRV
ncbi:MAG TPA: hypothetical protein PLN69_03015 [bacterium]|nr:hypothetical protein [bacterium]